MDDIKHSETTVRHTDGEQNTGNHPIASEPGGADLVGGTRTGAENVEPAQSGRVTDKTSPAATAQQLDEDLSVSGPAERETERDERGRL